MGASISSSESKASQSNEFLSAGPKNCMLAWRLGTPEISCFGITSAVLVVRHISRKTSELFDPTKPSSQPLFLFLFDFVVNILWLLSKSHHAHFWTSPASLVSKIKLCGWQTSPTTPPNIVVTLISNPIYIEPHTAKYSSKIKLTCHGKHLCVTSFIGFVTPPPVWRTSTVYNDRSRRQLSNECRIIKNRGLCGESWPTKVLIFSQFFDITINARDTVTNENRQFPPQNRRFQKVAREKGCEGAVQISHNFVTSRLEPYVVKNAFHGTELK